jgi:cysteine-rich CWC protein
MVARASSQEPIEATSNAIREKTCEACGATFECRAGGCWCDDVALAAITRAELRARYDDCLCPTCLIGRQKTGG